MKGLSFRQDLGLKIASLVLSLLLWLFVQDQEARKIPHSFTVDVALNPEPENLQLVSPGDPKVNVTVYGSLEEIEEFQRRRRSELIKANVDGRNVEPGEGTYQVTLFPRTELANLDIREPPEVHLTFEEKITASRRVEIVPGGEPPVGFEFDAADISPPMVELSGPRSLVTDAKVQAKLNLTNIRSGTTYEAPVEVIGKDGKPVPPDQVKRTPDSVEVTPSLTPAKPRRTLLVSPIYRGQPAPGFHVSRVTFDPPTVIVQGERAKIQGASVIETTPIDLTGLNARTERQVALQFPAGVNPMATRQIRVVIYVEPDLPPQQQQPPQKPPS